MSKSVFHRDANVAKFLPLDVRLTLSSKGDAFNVLLCLVSMVPERILASVTSVAAIYLLRYILVFLRYLMAVPTQVDMYSIQMHLILGFVSFVLSILCSVVGNYQHHQFFCLL